MAHGKFNDEYFEKNLFKNAEYKFQATVTKLHEKMSHQPAATYEKKNQIKLPRIDIPIYDGNYLKWPSFKDLFMELIHKDKNITNAEKLFYLKTNLTGEPGELIRHLSVTNENYNTAWEILDNRYNNKRVLVTAQLKSLLCQPELIKESADGIKKLHDSVTESLQAIKNLGIDTSSWDSMIIFLLTQKLDKETHRLYEQSLQKPREIQTLKEFLGFLETRFHGLEAMEPSKRHSLKIHEKNEKQYKANHNAITQQSCPVCTGQHKVYFCEKLSKMPVDQRLDAIRKAKLCTNCLAKGHPVIACKSWKRCKICNKKHHTFLHLNLKQTKESEKERGIESDTSKQVTHHLANNEIHHTVLLATAIVQVMRKDGDYINLRALVDQGAQCSFITEDAVQQLKLQKRNTNAVVTGVGETNVGNIKTSVELTVKPRFASSFTITTTAMVLKKLTKILPSEKIIPKVWRHTKDLILADPEYYTPGKIDIILGADVIAKILLNNVLRGAPGSPIAQHTELGWILSGEVQRETNLGKRIQCFVAEVDISKDLQKFWEIEELKGEPIMTVEEMACEKYYKNTTRRDASGRYTVRIPFRENPENSDKLSDSRNAALARLFQIERKFKTDKKYETLYKAFMNEYIELGHMIPVNNNLGKRFYLPHHAVLKDSSTTKLRVVFDASVRSDSNSKSINDLMMVGPQIQQKLTEILLRWRKHKFVLTADIEKMYRQIKVDIRDQDFQRILWRNSQDEPIIEYNLTTVTYGTAAAPFLAIRTLQELANNDKLKHPKAAMVLLNDTYVDDVVSGADSEEEVIELSKELIKLLKGGGFNLRKWCSNSRNLLKTIPWEQREFASDLDFDQDKSIKALGVRWSLSTDMFKIQATLNNQALPVTKRNVLSEAAKVFDPIGLLSPVTITIKQLLQDIWQSGTNWDERLPNNILHRWLRIRAELPNLQSIEIPRWVNYTRDCKCTLHGFSDASEKAYSAAIYIRIQTDKENVTTKLLVAKTKVAPLQSKLSLPKLELCGATLLARLLSETIKCLKIDDLEYHAWTDSTIVLAWIQEDPHKWKTFVANRVAEIQSLTDCRRWHHVKSDENPADVASRGIFPASLRNLTLWWEGPHWLKGEELFTTELVAKTELERKRVSINTAISTNENVLDILLKKHSSLLKLQRILAYCKRFIKNCQLKNSQRNHDLLSLKELNEALILLIRYTQHLHFEDEITKIKGKEELKKGNRLIKLTPYIDNYQVLRVGGRLENSEFCYGQKHPIILPYNSELTALILERVHKECLHGTHEEMLFLLRKNYWVLNGSKAVKAQKHKCVICHRHKTQLAQQMMGMLPRARVVSHPPFTHTGVDYAGPFDLLLAKGRGNRTTKGYIALFVCLTTKAVHIEVVTDLTSNAFIAAFKRFVSRRGPVQHLYSDNATNFTGASKIISDLHKQQSFKEDVNNTLLDKGTEWHFIPPASPHFGGLWEAGIKSIKHHMKRVVGNGHLTYEEMCTLTTQIEACLNSRPLCPLTDDPESLEVLTPGHFLTGSPLITVSDKNQLETNSNLLNRWSKVTRMFQDFWKKWHMEYLGRLQYRPKWAQRQRNIEKGNIVLIKEEQLPPSKWALGRVIETHPGSDGLTRVVTLKTERGNCKRPIAKLSLLPILDNYTEKTNVLEDELSNDEETTCTQHVASTTLIKQNQTKNDSSGQKRRDSENSSDYYSNKRARTERNKFSSTSRCNPGNIIYLCIFAFLFIITLGEEVKKPYNITELQNREGIYFDSIGDVQLYSREWNLLIYYDLTSYWKEFAGIKRSIRRLTELCEEHDHIGVAKEMCGATITQLKFHILESEHINEVLYQQNENFQIRKRRAPLEIVGTIANKLFGILDQDFAERYEQQIENIKENENLVKGLLKNQTSIIENTVNIIKKNHNSVQQQLNMVEGQIDSIVKYINNSEREGLTTATFNSVTVLLTLNIIHFQSVQRSLLAVVTDTKHGRLNTLLLTPAQLNDHLKIIREHLPQDVKLPGGGNSNGLLTIYNSMYVKVRLTEKRVLFDTRLPLINIEKFHLYKLISIPVVHSDKLFYIQPTTTYLAVNSYKDRFTPFNEEELRNCIYTTEKLLTCNLHHPIFTPNSNRSKCEIDLLVNPRKISPFCKINSKDLQEIWIKLQEPSSWFYCTYEEGHYNIICEDTTFHALLKGNGIIQINPGCVISHPSLYISANDRIPQQLHSSLIPETQIISSHLNMTLSNKNSTKALNLPQLITEVNINDLEKLETTIKEQQHNIDGIHALNVHDLHHYGSTYIIASIILVLMMIYWWKRRRSHDVRRKGITGTRPEPKPRRFIHNKEHHDEPRLPSLNLEPGECAQHI